MTTIKQPFAFRLSSQAAKSLTELRAKTGMNQTAIVEYALANLNNGLKGTQVNTITNSHGREIDFDAAANLMDDDLREKLANNGTEYVSDQQFFNAYCAAHEQKFGEEFEPNKANPVW